MLSVANSIILSRALTEINALGAGGAPAAEIMALALATENEILDQWNAERGKVYADAFLPFTITANLQPHTIGPAGATWVTTQAPIDINGIQVQLTGTPTPYVYVKKRDAQWWQTRPAPTVTASFPTDFFYNPTWTTAAPWGSIYFWPVPTTAYDVQLWLRIILAQLETNTTISLPPGYSRALMLSVARALAPVLRKPWTGQQESEFTKAIQIIESNNIDVPRITTRDSGMPSQLSSGLPDFFWPSGAVGRYP